MKESNDLAEKRNGEEGKILKSNKKLLWSFVCLMFLVFESVVIIVDVRVMANGTYFYVGPPEVKDIMPPDEFQIQINITEAPPTYAWEIFLSWDPALLNVSSIKEGDFLHRWRFVPVPPPGKWVPAYDTIFAYVPFDEANLKGKIQVGCALSNANMTWANGTGWLCTLGFKVKTYGTCVLNLSDTSLADHLAGDPPYPAYTYYPNLDGFFTNKHDIAITDVTCNSTTVYIGQVVAVNVTATNEGGFAETFNVTAYYDDTPIQTQTDITLDPGANTTLTFPWNTTYAGAGVYTIKANASQVPKEINLTNNLYTNGVVTVSLPGYPIADFTYSPKNPLVDEVVTFNSTSYDEDGHIVSWEWDFNGDGVIDAYTENATWTYTEYGEFVTKLTVEDNDGFKSIPKEKLVTVFALPKASFVYSPERPLINEKVTFNASLSTANGESIVSYKWDFGDGTILLYTGENLTTSTTHQYETVGTYPVTLTVTDSENLKDSKSEIIKVLARPLAARFTLSPSDPMRNELITFNASNSRDVDGTIVSYKWDFGDGTTKIYVGANLTVATTHTYLELLPDDKPFYVTLNVTDNDGLYDTYKLGIPVSPIHDIAVSDIMPSTNTAAIGDVLPIDVTVKNVGDRQLTDENLPFNVTIYYDETKIQTLAVTEKLAPNDSHTLSFTWDTTNMNPNTYRIKAIAETKKRDFNTTNNELIDSEVTLKPGSTLTIFVHPESATLGETIIINGTVTPTHQDLDVTIQYRPSGQTEWNTLTVVKTDSTGSYKYLWTPETTGTYEIKAKWPGDSNTLGDESDTQTIAVEEGPTTPNITLYLIIAIIILVVVAAIVIYFRKFRKK
jgi:PKD repeat protein